MDGKPREDGVIAFLQSRGIEVPLGGRDDCPSVHSVHGLGNLKYHYFLEALTQDGVECYESSIDLARALREQDVKDGGCPSSKNCAAVLEAAGIAKIFDAHVDGLDLSRMDLHGKPEPDAFLEAAKRLRVEPSRAVVVEDAIAGVEAGHAGRFGLVIDVDRVGRPLG